MKLKITYPVVSVNRRSKRRCPQCGDWTVRTKKFSQNLSPYHDAVRPGMSLTEMNRAVFDAVSEEADQWNPDHTHAACQKEK